MFMLVAHALLGVAGVWHMHSRICGCNCLICCWCLNLAFIITGYVIRFGTQGKLASLSLTGSKFSGDTTLSFTDTNFITNERTYVMDGHLIMVLWGLSLAFCCVHCCSMCCCVLSFPEKAATDQSTSQRLIN